MLNKYSTSPSRSLTIRPSRQRQYCTLGFGLLLAFALYRIFDQGYPILCLLLSLGSLVLLCPVLADPMAGAVLIWERGNWSLHRRGEKISLLLLPGSVRLPWLIHMVFREAHTQRCWVFLLFTDSAGVESLRRLRCRLTLERS